MLCAACLDSGAVKTWPRHELVWLSHPLFNFEKTEINRCQSVIQDYANNMSFIVVPIIYVCMYVCMYIFTSPSDVPNDVTVPIESVTSIAGTDDLPVAIT